MRRPSRSLSELAPGEAGRVSGVLAERHLRRRLLELGLVPGTLVRVVRVAPMSDPIEVRLRGGALSLRKAEAAGISVSEEAE